MARKIAEAILRGVEYIRLHPQFLFTLGLILLIPLAFLYSGQQFLDVAHSNQARLEGNRVGILQDSFASFVSYHSEEPDILQSEIKRLVEQNADVTKFRILKEEGTDLRVIAALDSSLLNTLVEDGDIYRVALQNEGVSSRIEFAETYEQDRFWQVFRAVRLDNGELYYIFNEIEFGNLDALFASRILNAYGALFFVLLIVLFLAYRHIRMIDYGYLYRETKKANETRDLFTNMVTHELRAPLTAMRGYSSMITENKNVDPTVKEQAVRIQQSSERLLLIVNDLLEVARLQSGKLQIEKASSDIRIIIPAVLSGLESSAAEKNITLASDVSGAPESFYTDPKRLHQILTNLVSNAIKYTEQGNITVVIIDKPTKLQIRVQDTGMGIAAEDQQKLFAPFFRVQSDDVSKITGTGLGMWITKQMVSLLGGTINVESIRNVGTHVVVTLPKEKNT